MADITIKKENVLENEEGYEKINYGEYEIELNPHNKNILEKIRKKEKELENVKGTCCEIYSRVVGYFRPIKNWNDGKKEEFKDRKTFIFNKEKNNGKNK